MNTEFPTSYPLNRFSIAPMLDLTDRHCRYFHRLLTKNTLLYTEMVTTGAIMFGKGDYLAFNQDEHPLALQLGGSDPNALAHCAKLAEQRYYDEINLNVGCPSDRVQNGKFGACLMAEPKLVADCVKAMHDEVTVPVTVKTRLGIDDLDSYQFLYDFIQIVSEQGGCETFIIHARKAWLSGLSPKENRDIPPLDYSRVWQIKKDFPHLTIAINGGITSLNEAKQHLQHVDGVMMGRQAYQHPALLANVDHQLFATETACEAEYSTQQGIDIIESFYPYIEEQLRQGVYLGHMTRHILGLFQGIPGAKQWRRYLSENAHKPGADIKVVEQALSYIKQGDAGRR